MANSRRRLTFSPPVEEQENKQGNICTLCLAPHTQLSAPASWKNAHAQEVACKHAASITTAEPCLSIVPR